MEKLALLGWNTSGFEKVWNALWKGCSLDVQGAKAFTTRRVE